MTSPSATQDTARDTTYNGWTNYETWCVNLWLDNDGWMNDRAADLADEARATEYPRSYIADELKELIEADEPELHGMYADLLSAAISSVNWHELADGILDSYPAEATAVEDAE